MSRIERFHPGTKISEWLSGRISAPLGVPETATGAGYFGGGYDCSSKLDSIDKLLFGVETCAAISATLSTAGPTARAMMERANARNITRETAAKLRQACLIMVLLDTWGEVKLPLVTLVR